MRVIYARTKIRKYKIFIYPDITNIFPELFRKKFSNASKIILITSDKIYSIFKNRIRNILEECNISNEIILIKDGEQYKNIKSANDIYKKLSVFNIHRDDAIIAFGGGVIGDLAGFTAATYHRGVKLIQYPTTITGQVDSSIGGKVVINYSNYKNVIGCFYQPHMIIIDPVLLYSLDELQIINGLAEIVKYGIVFDRKILDILDKNTETESKGRLEKLIKKKIFTDIIYRCALIKNKVVRKDEFDYGYRNLLNFGHTIGHCIEKAANLKKINHGQAISMGMIIAIDISSKLGLLKREFKNRIIKIYKKLKLPFIIPKLELSSIMDSLEHDKKIKGSGNKFILLKGLNRPVFYYNVDKDIITSSISENMAKN